MLTNRWTGKQIMVYAYNKMLSKIWKNEVDTHTYLGESPKNYGDIYSEDLNISQETLINILNIAVRQAGVLPHFVFLKETMIIRRLKK